MPIAMEKQKQVKKYIDRLIQQKNGELEKAVEQGEKTYAESAFSRKKAELETVFLPAIEKYNTVLITMKSLANQNGYYLSYERHYFRYSVREMEPKTGVFVGDVSAMVRDKL